MTTIDAALSWAGRRMVSRAEANTRKRRSVPVAPIMTQVWHLVMVLGGLTAVTYGVYQLTEPGGWIAGGLCAFIARSLITWEGGATNGPPRS